MNAPAGLGLLDLCMRELQSLSEKSEGEAKIRRRELWVQMAGALGRTPESLALDLAKKLEVQPVTTRRWISGEYGPRLSHLNQMRNEFGLAVPRDLSVPQTGPGMDPPVAFEGGFVAVRSINHVFFCAKRAHAILILKGLKAFRVGRSQQVRERVIELLQNRDELTLYYVFPEQSEAARSLEDFKARQFVKDSGVLPRIKGVAIPAATGPDPFGLANSPVSSFVVLYSLEGIREFKRELDIWLEIPVEELDAANRLVDDTRAKSIFVQLPEQESREVWSQWKGLVAPVFYDQGVPFPTDTPS